MGRILSSVAGLSIAMVVAGCGGEEPKEDVGPDEMNASSVESATSAEQACIESGGVVTSALCCACVSDFPNLCLIGACGCSGEHSVPTRICECPPDRCFDGTACVERR